MVYLSTIKKQSNRKSKLNSSSAPVCLQKDTPHKSNLRLDVFNSEVWRDFCHLGIKRCTLVRMANWPDVISNNCRSNMRLERDVLKYGPAKTRLTPKYEGLLAKGALWWEWTIAKFRRSIFIGTQVFHCRTQDCRNLWENCQKETFLFFLLFPNVSFNHNFHRAWFSYSKGHVTVHLENVWL